MILDSVTTQIPTPKGIHAFLSHAPLNVAFHAGGNSKEEVLANRRALIAPILLENLAYLNQIHSNTILHAKSGGLLGDGDGIIITQPGILGMVMVADCNPILLFDHQKKILILLHAGRMGLQNGILKHAIEIFQKEFQSHLKNLFVYVGPSIRQCCYEVKEDVFNTEILEVGKVLRGGKIYLDLIAILKAHLKPYGIEYTISPQCTCCKKGFFSYRRDADCGRFALFAALRRDA